MSKQLYTDAEKAERAKRLSSIVEKINKDHGQGAVMDLDEKPQNVEVISTGSIGLDIALGVGGFPRGRIIEIFGPESSGKTTLAIHAIAECQQLGGIAAVIDAEHAFDRQYAEALGVDISALKISQPDNGEQALEIADALIRSNSIDLILIDSVAALVPKSELDGEMGDSKMGLHARLMSQAMRKMTGGINNSNCICIFINQLREKIGITWGNPEVTTGGNALKFYASVRLDVRRENKPVQDKEGDAFASHVKVKVIKNKVAPPFRVAEFDIEFGRGISKEGEVLDLGVTYDVIKKSGNSYYYENNRLGTGRDSAKQFIQDNMDVMYELQDKIMEVCFPTAEVAPETESEEKE